MEIVVKKWGNSLGVRIPSAIAGVAHLQVEQTVEVSANPDGSILIRPLKRREYRLDDLLGRITPDNLHDEAGFGQPVGKELL